jgi:DNA-directed RNA polymerase subunit F
VVAPKHYGGKFPATMLQKDLTIKKMWNLLLHWLVSQEQQALHYELHKNIALQHRVTLSQAEKIQNFKEENADLKKQLSEAQG